jgi:hypothetical protein
MRRKIVMHKVHVLMIDGHFSLKICLFIITNKIPVVSRTTDHESCGFASQELNKLLIPPDNKDKTTVL